MKYSALALAATAAAAAETLDLQIVSENQNLDGKGIQALHEGAGISYFGVSDYLGEEFNYDKDKKLLYQFQGSYQANVGFSSSFFAVGPAVTPGQVTFDDQGRFDIGEQLYACKDLNDPYNYFEDRYGVVREAPNDSCVKIGLKRVQRGSSGSSSASASGTASGTVSASATASSAYWNTTTITDVTTVTGITTYCPEPTTFTITTCVEENCGPTTVTVEEPSTVTITEKCVVSTGGGEPTTPTTVAGPLTSAGASLAAVSSWEAGAVKNAAGVVAGVAGLAVLI